MRMFRLLPTSKTIFAVVLSPMTVGMVLVGMALHAPSQTFGAPGTPLTLIPTPSTPANTAVPPFIVTETATPAATSTLVPPAPTNTPKPKKTATPRPTRTAVPGPVPIPTVPVHTGGGGCNAVCALFSMRYTVQELGSFHLDFHLKILPRDHSQRLTHFVADVSLRNHQLRGSQLTQVTQPGRRPLEYRYLYEDVGTNQAILTQGKWTCYKIAPVGGPPYTVNLRDRQLRAAYAGRIQKVSGVPALPINARSHGASVYPQGTLVSHLLMSDYDLRLLRESTSFSTSIQGHAASSTYTADFSKYRERVSVQLPRCSRTLSLETANAWLPFVMSMVDGVTLDQTTPSTRATRKLIKEAKS